MMKKTGKERLDLFLEWGKQYSRLFRFWTSPFKAIVILHHPETIKVLFKSTGEHCKAYEHLVCIVEPKNRAFGGGYRHILPWLGEGLLVTGGERWARSRRLLTPAFHFDILHPYIKIYNDSAELMLVRKRHPYVEAVKEISNAVDVRSR
ncbi:hypothetical protein KUTeg_014237 [Tegillarca granosa]|uniref:Cytochrome P450 n=1 Tax=Tegillarca granosa TaxID=220873 RepID=A0ABQ9EW31_TEGGR|nr:hypothetical protein KUTeg_014237 [Tegillarca granosa]